MMERFGQRNASNRSTHIIRRTFYTDLTNSIWGTKYESNLYVMSLLKLTRKCTVVVVVVVVVLYLNSVKNLQ